MPREARHRILDRTMHRDCAAVGVHLREVDLGADQLEAVVGEAELLRHRRQVRELIAECMEIVAKARERDLLGDRHPADHAVLVDDEHRQARTGKIARAGQAVVARADDDGIVGRRHAR
jgi:hypothetical protein